MLTLRHSLLATVFALAAATPAAAQELQPHRAAYDVYTLDHGRTGESAGTYAFELKATCEGYAVTQRMRLSLDGGGRNSVTTESQSVMTESRDGRKLHFEHRQTANGKQMSLFKGDATLDDNGAGEARFTDPEGQSVALPAGTMFPMAITRATIRHAKAGDTSFDALFFFGEKPKPPQSVNMVLGRVPKRLADVKIPDGAAAIADGRTRVYYRGGFFDYDEKGKGEQATFEMSSLTLDNGVELYGTHEERDAGIEYRISRLEALPKPNCN